MTCLSPLSTWSCDIRSAGLKWPWHILLDFLPNSGRQLGMKTCSWNRYVFPITHCTSTLWLYQFAECLGLLLRPICTHAYHTSTNPIMCPIHLSRFQSWGSPTGHHQYHLWNWPQQHEANPRALARLAAKHGWSYLWIQASMMGGWHSRLSPQGITILHIQFLCKGGNLLPGMWIAWIMIVG